MYVVWFTPLVLAAYTAFLRPAEVTRLLTTRFGGPVKPRAGG